MIAVELTSGESPIILGQRAYMNQRAAWEYRSDLAENIRPALAKIQQPLSNLKLS